MHIWIQSIRTMCKKSNYQYILRKFYFYDFIQNVSNTMKNQFSKCFKMLAKIIGNVLKTIESS